MNTIQIATLAATEALRAVVLGSVAIGLIVLVLVATCERENTSEKRNVP